jgi:hypothetical protein
VTTRKAAIALVALLARGTLAMPPAQEQGREIYRRGTAAGAPITIQLPGSGVKMPAARFACLDCHGIRGEGTVEGGVRIPAIHRAALFSDRDGWNRPRIPYTAALVARAITEGLNAGGRPLHRAMPRYQMTAQQLSGLLEYLEVLNTEEDIETGVTENSVLIGARLPPGTLADAVRAALERVFARVNAAGGIYGRQLKLLTTDSDSWSEEPLALVADLRQGIRQNGVPALDPLRFSSGEPADARTAVFPFLPSFADQTRTMMLYATMSGKWRRPILVGPGGAPGSTGDSWASAFVARCESRAGLVCVRENGADAIVFLGSGAELEQLTAALERERLSPAVLASLVSLETTGWRRTPGYSGDLYLASPSREGKLPVAPILAEAAAEVAVEALKRAGRFVSRPGFSKVLAAMRDPETGSYNGVPLPPGLWIRPSGAYLVRLDSATGQLSAAGDWLTPPN